MGVKKRELEKKTLEFLNLKVKFGKITDRLAESLEKIEGLEKANAALKEENNRLNKELLYEKKLKGGKS